MWGRPTIAWALDVGVVLLAVALLIWGDPTLKMLAVLLVVWRAVSAALGVVVQRRLQGRR